MSMSYWGVNGFGVNIKDLNLASNIKEELLEITPSSLNEISYNINDPLNLLNIENGSDDVYIMMFNSMPWQKVEGEPQTEKEARAYIAKAIASICGKTEKEIIALCDYVDDFYYG